MLKKIFCLIIACAVYSVAQESDDTKVLAKVGDKVITVKEFRIRYELYPQVNRTAKTNAAKKKEDLLHSLIAEKLWSLEAENFRLDTTDVMQFTFPAIENMYLRDALYSKEIKSKIKFSDSDVEKSLARMQYDALVRYFYSANRDSINRIYKVLNSGVSFDSLFLQDTTNLQNANIVEFGKMEEFIEDSIYSLLIGAYTSPLKSSAGWYIFKLDGLQPNASFKNLNDDTRNSKLRTVLEQRAVNKINNEFYNTFFKNKKVETDGDLFWSLSNKIISALLSRIDNATENGNKLVLKSEDLQTIQKSFGNDSLNMTFVKFNDNPISVKKFLHDFFLEGFTTTFTKPEIIRSQLQSRVKYFIERELLSRESIKQGLQNDPEVTSFRNIWRDNYLATLYKTKLLKEVTVTDNEIFEHYNANNKIAALPKMVNIVEILSDSLEIIERVLRHLDEGKTLRDLAPLYTKRIWTRDNGGEFGFFPVTAYGEIGRLAGEMEIGDLMGPIETPDGYSIFELIDSKNVQDNLPKPFEEIKDELKTNLRVQKLRNHFIDKTAELASKYGVNINNNLLGSVKAKDLSIFVYRYFGFGGRLPAVPITNPFTEWVDKWKENTKELP